MNPTLPTKSLKITIQQEYVLNVPIHKVYRVKNKISTMITSNEREKYGLLWNYCNEIYNKNSESTCIIKYRFDSKNDIFHRIYICFTALKEGFLQCRHIIGLHGCHLIYTLKGVLLIAIRIDLNNQIYLFAYARRRIIMHRIDDPSAY